MKKKNAILLVGLGAIGSVLYARLTRCKKEVVCVSSVDGTQLIRKKGLIVKLRSDASSQLYNCEIYSVLPEKYIFDKCIITTKSWTNEFIIDDIKDNLTSSASILLLQNGLGVEEPLLSYDNNWKISRVLTSLAAYREQRNQSIETYTGVSKIGLINYEDNEELEKWKTVLTEIGLKTIISSDIQKDIWLKVIANCTIGPLTAITGVRNGEIFKDTFLSRIAQQVIEEVVSVVPDEFSITFDEAYGMIEDIANQTAENKSSMLQDFENKTKTEINLLNGKIIEIAAEKEIEVPTNARLVELVKQIYDESIPKEQIFLELRSL